MILSLKKVAALGIVVSLFGVGATWGLKTLTAKEVTGPVEAETTYGPIKLTVRLDKNTFRLGENVNVTVTITNISNETILLAYSLPPKIDFAVYNSSSDIIFSYSRSGGWAMVEVRLILEPSESNSQMWEWNQVQANYYFESKQVQPGIYYIAGLTVPYYLGPKDEYRGDYVWLKVETSKVKIEITP